MQTHNYYVYITSNPGKTVLYTGVTNDLVRRLAEHRLNKGNPKTFAGRYYCYSLLYYERFNDINKAIEREKDIKLLGRSAKETLIKTLNPGMAYLNVYE